jgi:hypothetical protein
MNHLSEDFTLKFALETLSKNEMDSVQEHLSGCDKCHSQLLRIKKELDVIGSYNPEVEDVYFLPSNKNNKFSLLLKVAALLLIGFLFGYITSDYLDPIQINVTAQKVIPKTPAIDSTDFIYCPNVDIW